MRHLPVILFQPRLHLLKQRLLQRLGIGERGGRIGVFGFEVGSDLGVEQRWLAHHLLPVRGSEPAIVIGNRNAMMRGGAGQAPRDGRQSWINGVEF